jgi:hypothetical protein
VNADTQFRIADFTCTTSLLTGEKTHILTLESDEGFVFDAVVSSSTAERLLGLPEEMEEEAPSPSRPQAVEHQDDEEQG